jgi:hypothetical protein
MRDADYNDAFFDGVMTTLASIVGLVAVGFLVYLSVGEFVIK